MSMDEMGKDTTLEPVLKTLLLGAGHPPYKKTMAGVKSNGEKEGWGDLTTIDFNPSTNPTIVHDLNNTDLPFDGEVFDEIHAYSVLEHTGRQGDIPFFFRQWNEFWRILKPGGWFFGIVPAYNNEWAWGDPGHTRVFTPGTFIFLDKMQYEKQLGITAMSDYERFLDGRYWIPKSIELGTEELRFILRKNAKALGLQSIPAAIGNIAGVEQGLQKAMATPEMQEKFKAELQRLMAVEPVNG